MPETVRSKWRRILLAIALLAVIGAGAFLARGGMLSAAAESELDRLDPGLRSALRAAMTAAEADGVEIRITSGRRTPQEQQRLFEEAVQEYGSEAEARRWVTPPDRVSRHVVGKAVDVGPKRAAAWLRQHGPGFGLCQVYANEAWHFERIARDGHCPELLLDATRG